MNPERFKYFTIHSKILINPFTIQLNITSKISKLIMFISYYLNINYINIICALLSLKIVNIL
jgi:hypothetical protein